MLMIVSDEPVIPPQLQLNMYLFTHFPKWSIRTRGNNKMRTANASLCLLYNSFAKKQNWRTNSSQLPTLHSYFYVESIYVIIFFMLYLIFLFMHINIYDYVQRNHVSFDLVRRHAVMYRYLLGYCKMVFRPTSSKVFRIVFGLFRCSFKSMIQNQNYFVPSFSVLKIMIILNFQERFSNVLSPPDEQN